MKVIFLDIDGVLNSGRSFLAFGHLANDYPDDPYFAKISKATVDPVSVGLLNRILRANDDIYYVLSSTHRKHFPDCSTKRKLIDQYMVNHGVIPNRCVGYTKSLNKIRGEEIQDWLDNHLDLQIDNYIILDDSSDFLPHQMQYHVHCKGGHGITEENYFQMSTLLGAKDYRNII